MPKNSLLLWYMILGHSNKSFPFHMWVGGFINSLSYYPRRRRRVARVYRIAGIFGGIKIWRIAHFL